MVGKKAVVAMETGDCDGAVDAALVALKMSSFKSNGLYLLVQDSVANEINGRLRDRLSRCRSGNYLDKMTDILNHPEFIASKEVTDYLDQTRLDV